MFTRTEKENMAATNKSEITKKRPPHPVGGKPFRSTEVLQICSGNALF